MQVSHLLLFSHYAMTNITFYSVFIITCLKSLFSFSGGRAFSLAGEFGLFRVLYVTTDENIIHFSVWCCVQATVF